MRMVRFASRTDIRLGVEVLVVVRGQLPDIDV
jgi:hypothetical protein